MHLPRLFGFVLSASVVAAVTSGCESTAPETAHDAGLAADSTTSDDASLGSDTTANADAVPADTSESADSVDAAVVPMPEEPTQINRCGLAFQWLPRDQVGASVSWTENSLSNLPKEAIGALIGQTGYKGLPESKYGARTWALRYTTQDKGKLIEATAMVGAPMDWTATTPPPVLVWAHGTTGFMDDCAPSRDELQGAGVVALLASLGFVVVSPDYIGLIGFGESSPAGNIHPYMVGEAVAVGMLDAVRAAQGELGKEAGVPVGDPQRLVLLGGSQGGHAVFFADRLLPYYAPEFNHIATVAVVPPTDLYDHALHGITTFGPTTGAFAAATVAMHKWYGLPLPLTAWLTESIAVALPDAMTSSCDPTEGIPETQLDEITDVYAGPFLTAMQSEDWTGREDLRCILEQNSLHRLAWPRLRDVPVLTTYGEVDNLVITPLQRIDTGRLCEQGYDIEYLECAGKGHTPGATASLPYAVQWLFDRLDNKPLDAAKRCVVSPPVDCSTLP